MTTAAEPRPATGPVQAALLFGRAWLERGQPQAAATHLKRALTLAPNHPDVHRWLAYLSLTQEDFEEAVTHMDIACRDAPPDSPLQREAALLHGLAGRPPAPSPLPDHPGGRLRFSNRWERTHHRSGWRYAMESLYGLHRSDGVLFEGFLEEPFAWQHPRSGIRSGSELLEALRHPDYETRLTSEELHLVPYREPWVGFLHNPPNMPSWFHAAESPLTILAKPVWQQSLRQCIGLFTLSESAAVWLRKATGKPVSALFHPTEIPELLFDFERFLANPQKLIVQVGWWLRRLGAIDRLPIPRDNPSDYTKLRLMPEFFPGAATYLHELIELEYQRDGQPSPAAAANTLERWHVSNAEYDRLLSENICFVSLYDASANNAVVECLARGTPILINRLPAVEEYLGTDYPLYYDDLADAAAKVQDMSRLRSAHEWLLECETRNRLGADSFRHAFEQSEVYQLL